MGSVTCRAAFWATVTASALVASWPTGAEAQKGSLRDVAFLTGCWEGRMGELRMLEQWTGSEGGSMLGTTRYLRDGGLVDWEFARILEQDGLVTLWPYPKGDRSPNGFPLVSAGDEIVFENLEHDFPVRIVYAPSGETGLNPRIEGRDGRSVRWSLQRVDCPR